MHARPQWNKMRNWQLTSENTQISWDKTMYCWIKSGMKKSDRRIWKFLRVKWKGDPTLPAPLRHSQADLRGVFTGLILKCLRSPVTLAQWCTSELYRSKKRQTKGSKWPETRVSRAEISELDQEQQELDEKPVTWKDCLDWSTQAQLTNRQIQDL